jgi:uncharacterized damage-inducible protein DinB
MPERALTARIASEWEALVRRSADETRSRPEWLVPGRPVFPARPMALFAQLEEVLALWAELRGAPLARSANRFITASWTLKDLLGHLASWAAEFRREVETMARGGTFDYAIPYALSVMGPNAWNAEAAEGQRSASLESILDEFEEQTGRLQDLVLAVPEDRLYVPTPSPLAPSGDPNATMQASIAQIVLGKCMHDRYHLGRIAAWLDQVRESERPGRPTRKKRRKR